MIRKNFKVQFATTSVGSEGERLSQYLPDLLKRYGEHLPVFETQHDKHQIRDLKRVNHVWMGAFCKLRTDPPHIATERGQEEEIDLADDEFVLEKCHFLYKEGSDVVVWQVNQTAGGLSRASAYLSQVLDTSVMLLYVMDAERLEEVLKGQIYEISYHYAMPHHEYDDAPAWGQRQFDTMNEVGAAKAIVTLRAGRKSHMSGKAADFVRSLFRSHDVDKLRVRLTDETDPIELFAAPLRESIAVNMQGRYPDPQDVFAELEDAFERNRSHFK